MKKKICYKCKKEIEPCVCAFFITHWNEDEDEYECFNCWTSREKELLEQEKHTRKILKEYLYIILTSKPLQLMMDAIATGQYMRLKEEELAKIKIPVPDTIEQNKIIKEYNKEKEGALKLQQNSIDKIDSLNNKMEEIILN